MGTVTSVARNAGDDGTAIAVDVQDSELGAGHTDAAVLEAASRTLRKEMRKLQEAAAADAVIADANAAKIEPVVTVPPSPRWNSWPAPARPLRAPRQSHRSLR